MRRLRALALGATLFAILACGEGPPRDTAPGQLVIRQEFDGTFFQEGALTVFKVVDADGASVVHDTRRLAPGNVPLVDRSIEAGRYTVEIWQHACSVSGCGADDDRRALASDFPTTSPYACSATFDVDAASATTVTYRFGATAPGQKCQMSVE